VTFLSAIFNLFRGKKVALEAVAVDKIFFGIGNPGPQYKNTRHNIGFAAIDRMSRSLSAVSKYRIGGGDVAVCRCEGLKCAFVKPLTYVNQCGSALQAIVEKTRCPLESCLVIVDDYHLPLGTLRLRRGGSDGGHNGLKSIIERVGTAFPRLRIGIGPIPGSQGSIEFVLGKFEEKESTLVQNALQKAEAAMMMFALQGIDTAMSAINGNQRRDSKKSGNNF
jgi:PTH1 family peptidyl-tRNA hydrolase